VSSVAHAFAAASARQTQIALAAEMLKINAQAAASIVEVLEAAIQNAQAALPAGVGANLDISV
jgi:UDP-N-acetyl-D-mannosaminuronate dehydrogenase